MRGPLVSTNRPPAGAGPNETTAVVDVTVIAGDTCQLAPSGLDATTRRGGSPAGPARPSRKASGAATAALALCDPAAARLSASDAAARTVTVEPAETLFDGPALRQPPGPTVNNPLEPAWEHAAPTTRVAPE